MAVNLLRNSRVFFTTNVDSNGFVKTGQDDTSSIKTYYIKTATPDAALNATGATFTTAATAGSSITIAHGLAIGDKVSIVMSGPDLSNAALQPYAQVVTVTDVPSTVTFAGTFEVPLTNVNADPVVFASANFRYSKVSTIYPTKLAKLAPGSITYVPDDVTKKYTLALKLEKTTGIVAGSKLTIYNLSSVVITLIVTLTPVAGLVTGYSNVPLVITTGVPTNQVIAASLIYVTPESKAHSRSTTTEILVQDGFSFSQSTQTETVQLSEAGPAPLRGQRQFNTSMDPVEFSFTTYIRPGVVSGEVTSDERVLWNALTSKLSIGDYFSYAPTRVTSLVMDAVTKIVTITFSQSADVTALAAALAVGDVFTIRGISASAVTATQWNNPVKLKSIASATTITVEYLTTPTAPASQVTFNSEVAASTIRFARGGWSQSPSLALVHLGTSDTHTLQEFGLIITMDDLTYVIDKCVIDQASIDFGIDQIASIAWTGKGTRLKQYEKAIISTADINNASLLEGTELYGTVGRANSKATFLANKLTTAILKSKIGGYNGTEYFVPITGGNVTISNNITYLTPAIIGVVNKPVAYFTGNRTVTGNFTAYLRSGTASAGVYNTSSLVDELYGSNILGNNTGAPAVDPKFYLELHVGGVSSGTKVQFDMNAVSLQLPKINTDSVMSIDVGFAAQGSTSDASATTADFDIENRNELQVRYFATA